MTKSNITEYDKIAANNTDVQDVPLGENLMYPADVNNAFREIMADLAAVNDGTVALSSPAFTSGSLTGDLSFGDNNKAIFGAGSDLAIYHTGTDSVIQDAGQGDLYVKASNNLWFQGNTSNDIMARFQDNGAVTLYYDNSAKLATTATGIDVTGTVTATSISVGDSHTIGNDGFDNLEITSSTSENIVLNPAGSVYLYNAGAAKLTTTATGIDVTGTVTADGLEIDGVFSFNNSGLNGEIKTYGSGTGIIYDALNGYHTFRENGTARMQIRAGGDIYLGYENTGTTAKLFWDASAERLGLGTSSPAATIDVVSSGANLGRFAATNGYIDLVDPSVTGRLQVSGNIFYMGTTASGDMLAFKTDANTERMRISSAGDVLISTTSNIVANSSTSSGTSIGSGLLESARAGVVAQFNRQNSDGSVIDIQRSGTTVGSIGTVDSDLYIHSSFSGHKGLRFGNGYVGPTNNSGTVEDNTTDLGLSSIRFKDLYLGGIANAVTINTDGPTGTGNGIVMAASGWPYKGRIGMNGTSGGKQYWTANYNLNTSSVDSASYYSTYIENSAQNGIVAFGTSSAANTAPTERMRITSSGNVGIGTSSPSCKLTVSSGASSAAVHSYTQLEIENSSHSALQFSGSTGAEQWIWFADDASSTPVGGITYYHGGPYMGFRVEGSERMRIDSGGIIKLITANDTAGTYKSLTFGTNAFNRAEIRVTNAATYDGSLEFYTGNASNYGERMRIDSSGRLLVNGTSNLYGQSVMQVTSGSNSWTTMRNIDQGSAQQYTMVFARSSSNVGAISTTNTSTIFTTTSDYRLKENVTGITDGIERVKQLNPSRFNFIADADTTVDGFLAHEAQTVVPEAVAGEKDAMRDEEYEVTPAVYEDVVIPAVLDDDGNEIEAERTEQQLVTEAVMGTRSVPDYQGIDQSKLVPLLTAALQEAITKIEDLEARVATLETN